MGTFDDLLRPDGLAIPALEHASVPGKRRVLFVLGEARTGAGETEIDLRGQLRQATPAEAALIIATHVLGQPAEGGPLRVRLPSTAPVADAVTPWMLGSAGPWEAELVGDPEITTVGSAQAWRALREKRRDPLGRGAVGGALERVADELLARARGGTPAPAVVAAVEDGLTKGEGPDEVSQRLSLAPEELARRIGLEWALLEPVFTRLAAQGHGKLYQRWTSFLPQLARPSRQPGASSATGRPALGRSPSPAVQHMQRLLAGTDGGGPSGSAPDRTEAAAATPPPRDDDDDDDLNYEESL